MRGADIMANRILELANKRDMSVRAIAMRSCIPETSLYSVTGRRAELSAQNIRKLCTTMDISADWLLGLVDEC